MPAIPFFLVHIGVLDLLGTVLAEQFAVIAEHLLLVLDRGLGHTPLGGVAALKSDRGVRLRLCAVWLSASGRASEPNE